MPILFWSGMVAVLVLVLVLKKKWGAGGSVMGHMHITQGQGQAECSNAYFKLQARECPNAQSSYLEQYNVISIIT